MLCLPSHVIVKLHLLIYHNSLSPLSFTLFISYTCLLLYLIHKYGFVTCL